MTALYSVAEIVAATGGKAESIQADSVSSISIDSREIATDALFVAIKGDRFDGHDFVAKAITAGAAAALVCEDRAADLKGLPLIIVPDALQGLRDLAAAARARSDAKIIAVTGSAGKTSTKEAIRLVCEAEGKTHASIKSFNNHWGVPLMLARMPRDTAFGVFEIGMSAAGEIEPLVQLVRPHIAIVTNVAAAHLENFSSIEGIAHAKAEIFAGLEPGGTAIINADHEWMPILVDAAEQAGAGEIITYGFSGVGHCQLSAYQETAQGASASIAIGGAVTRISIAAHGRHRVANAAAALLAARAAGIEDEVALSALAKMAEPEGRGAVTRLEGPNGVLSLIDESYNANPVSMVASLEVFAGLEVAGNRVLVLGDMLELGPQAAQLHAELAQTVLSASPDKVFLVGDAMASLAKALGARSDVVHASSAAEISHQLINNLDYGDAVMVKGSNSMQLNTLVAHIRDRF